VVVVLTWIPGRPAKLALRWALGLVPGHTNALALSVLHL
jgi:hypothetical protein